MPVISVVLPVFNAEKFIHEAVESVLAQSFSDFELIVIDDASADKTPEIIKHFDDDRIKIITNKVNLGLSRSLNKGLDLATGTFIARMDGDDICQPERFQRQVRFLDNHPEVDVCGSWVQFFGDQNRVLRNPLRHEDIKADLFFINNIIHPSVMFRRHRFLDHNLRYDETLHILEDYNLWINAVACNLIFANIPEVLLMYRIHGANFSLPKKTNKKSLDDGHYQIYKGFYRQLQLDYSSDDLEIHRMLGLRNTERLNKQELFSYLAFLAKLVSANTINCCINVRSFRIVIISCFSLLIQKTKLDSYPVILSSLVRLFTISDILHFIKYKVSINSKSVNTFNRSSQKDTAHPLLKV